MSVQVGDRVPSFQGYDEEGSLVTAEDLLGTVTVLYFYLRDETPGCTRQACDFRDLAKEFVARGVVVLGISPDTSSSHLSFIGKHALPFSLISDPRLEIARLFGIVEEREGKGPRLERSTFILDETGTIKWLESPVHDVEGHASRVLKVLDQL